MLFTSITTWLTQQAWPAMTALAEKPGLPGLGDWAQAAAAYYAYRTLREMGHADRATFVVAPSVTRVSLLASATHLFVASDANDPVCLRLANAGPAPALGVVLRFDLLIDPDVETLIDAPAPTGLGARHGVDLCFIGSPNGVALGAMTGGVLSTTHETYRITTRHVARVASLQDKGEIKEALPTDFMRAWLFAQTVLDDRGLAIQVPLRVRVSWRDRRGRVQSSAHFFELADRKITADARSLVCDYGIAELDCEDMPKALRDQNAVRAERARSVRYLDRARQQIDLFQGQAQPSLGRRARARVRNLLHQRPGARRRAADGLDRSRAA